MIFYTVILLYRIVILYFDLKLYNYHLFLYI